MLDVRHEAAFRSARPILLVTVLAAIGGLIAALLGGVQGDNYEAEAVVVASKSTLPVDFADLGATLFQTDTVIRPVIDELNLDLTPQELLSDGHLKVEPVTNAVAVRIVARDPSPQLAEELANSAADSFADALTDRELGTFSVFEDDEVSTIPNRTPLQSAILATAIGVVLGAAALTLRTVFAQPILTEEEAAATLPTDVVFSARVRSNPPSLLRKGPTERDAEFLPHGIAAAVRRAAGEGLADNTLRPCFVLVERSSRGDRAVRALLREMRPKRLKQGRKWNPHWVQASDERLSHLLEDAGAIVVLVSEGVSRRSLRSLAEEIWVAPGRKLLVLVFVRRYRRRLFPKSPQTNLPFSTFRRLIRPNRQSGPPRADRTLNKMLIIVGSSSISLKP